MTCGTELAPNLLTCPKCKRLIHAERLKALANEAARADTPVKALAAWREALELLPRGTRQHETIQAKITELGQVVDASPAASKPTQGAWGNGAAGIGAFALLCWKFKTIALLVLTKGKLLLLGLTKASTFTSMILSFGVYWTMFGWPLALGLVLSIYIHEMGHVFALTRYGVKISAPMFVPGLGAMVRLRQALDDPRQDARCGLAGPLWGLFAAIMFYGIGMATGLPVMFVIAKFGAWINLFNMLPLGSLDGGRAFRSMTKNQRWLAVIALGLLLTVTHDEHFTGVLILLMIGGALSALAGKSATKPDSQGLLAYVLLASVFALMAEIPQGALP